MGILLQLVIWTLTGWMAGLIVMIGALFVGVALPDSISRPIGDSAYARSNRAMKLGTIMRRKDEGGVGLFKLSPDTKMNALSVEIDGETKYFEDVSKFMGRCNDWPFGLTVERTMAVVSARAGDVGRVAADEYESGAIDYQETVELDNGQRYTTHKINSLIDLPDGQTFVDPVDALGVVAYDGRPEDPKTVEEYTAESQRKLVGGMDRVQMASLLVPLAAGPLINYFMFGVGEGSAPDPGSTIPIVVDLVAVVL
jgi:hypothetical protein